MRLFNMLSETSFTEPDPAATGWSFNVSVLCSYLWMETDQIHIESDAGVPFYHILIWMRMRIQIQNEWFE